MEKPYTASVSTSTSLGMRRTTAWYAAPMRRLFLAAILLTACNVSDETLVRVCEANGLHDAKATGFAPYSCSDDDDLATHFEAKNAAGTPVKGTVCCGWWGKDCTVRWE